MRFLLDTNVCVDYLRGHPSTVIATLQRHAPADLGLSSIVVAELRYGAERSARPSANHSRIDVLAAEIPAVDFDGAAAAAYGRLRGRLEKAGEVIGANDMLIAAQALSRKLVLVTDNESEFRRIKGLRVENWRR